MRSKDIALLDAKAVRDSGKFPPDAGFYLVARVLLDAAFESIEDPVVEAIGAKIDALEEAYGLKEGEFWPIGEAPDDVEALRAEYDAAFDRATVQFLRDHGEEEMATLYADDRSTFDRRLEMGRRYFFDTKVQPDQLH
ncbi:hypothetical protein [Archangium sp.]|uniref:hypothetical protein n=1 Tax=Archangium sp. TaxID=1872627 RepID=UPI00389A9655